MSLFNFFSKKSQEPTSESTSQTSSRRKAITAGFAEFIKREHSDMIEEPLLFLAAGLSFSVGAKEMDNRPQGMSIEDAIRKATSRAELMVAEACQSHNFIPSTADKFVELMLVCFAGVGAQWAAEHPENK